MSELIKLIETPRLTLRPFQEEDIDPLFAILGDAEAMRYTYTAPSREECANHLRGYAQLADTLGYAPWTVRLRSEPTMTEPPVIGWGGLNIDPFDPGWGIEVIYFFAPAYWGKGYASEVVRASLAYGFGTLSLPAIGAFAHTQNVGSRRVLEKGGFTHLGYEPLLDRERYEIQREAWLDAAGGV